MRRISSLGVAVLAVVLLASCNAEGSPSDSERRAVDKTVRHYIDLRNQGDLHGLLAASCEDLYISARNLLRLPDEQRHDVVASMRQHPAKVQHVTVDRAENFHFDATLVASANTAQGQQTGSQHVSVREYRDGYRVCKTDP